MPLLYLSGISTGNFQDALMASRGKDASNLSPAVVPADGLVGKARVRTLAEARFVDATTVYVWADGIFARMEDHGECMLVLISATTEGKKELIGFRVGVRKSAQSWRELLILVRQRGLQIARKLPSRTARSASGRRSTRSFPAGVAGDVALGRETSPAGPRPDQRRSGIVADHTMPHDRSASGGKLQVLPRGERPLEFELDSSRQKLPRTTTQDIGQWIVNLVGLTKRDNAGSPIHGVSFSLRAPAGFDTCLDTSLF
ncbi:hypothetical protein ACVIQY_002167 [Bradyrhizobium sp. USDA 3051]